MDIAGPGTESQSPEPLLAFGAQFMTDFSAANQNAPSRRDFAVRHHPSKSRAGEILDRGRRIGVAQHALGREHDHGLRQGATPAGAADENIAPRSTAGTLEIVFQPRVADNARCARWNVPAPGLRTRGAAASPARRQFPFSSAALMNWSIIVCAPFAKSPNCASQSTRVSG